MANWTSNNQQAGGWYSSSNSGWDGAATGYDIPIDDEPFLNQQNPSSVDSYFGASKTTQPVQAFESHDSVRFRQQPPSTYNSVFPNQLDSAPMVFSGQNFWNGVNSNAVADNFEEDDRPLLEELVERNRQLTGFCVVFLGINFDHIRQKTMAVLNPLMTTDMSVLNDNDLSGPLVFCLLFGFSLLLHGKIHFGYIYGIGLLGCTAMYALLNLMSASGISLTCAVSVLGYCLLPMSLLSLVAAVFSFRGLIGLSVAIAAVLWCSLSASKLFVTALSMDKQRILVAYPCSLFYGLFALMAIY